MRDRRAAAYGAEFLGTLLLVLFIALALAYQSVAGVGYRDFAVLGLVHAFALAGLLSIFRAGGYFNPAVTLALAALRRITPRDALAFVVMQLAGAVCGALLCKLIVLDLGRAVHFGAPAVSGIIGHATFSGALVELIGAFVLTLALLAAPPGTPRALSGGAVYGLTALVLTPLTGDAINPARAFGPALVAHSFGGAEKFILVFVLAPLLGGSLAALLERLRP